MTLLVTGGAGYIGSHMVKLLRAKNRRVVVLDDLSTGHRDAVPAGVDFVRGHTSDTAMLTRLLADFSVQAVLHFAAFI